MAGVRKVSQGIKIDGEKPDFCYPLKFGLSMRLRLTFVFRLNHKQTLQSCDILLVDNEFVSR